MRLILIIVILGIEVTTLHSQIEIKEWAPIGATWLYWSKTWGSNHRMVKVEHKKDTQLFRHIYKKFDIYYLEYQASTDNRYSKYITSYYIGIKGDTIFQPSFGREIYHVDRNKIGDTVYPFRACDPMDTVWYRLDTMYDYPYGSVKFKVKIYSGNNKPRYYPKDTLYSFFPGKHPIGDGDYHFESPMYSGFIHHGSLKCYQDNLLIDSPQLIETYPDVFSCYYDSIVGYYSNGYGFTCSYLEKFSSIKENILGDKIEIYPNPAENIIKVKGIDNRRKRLMGIIYNVEGKYIFSIPLSEDDINIAQLDRGIYYLSIQDQSEVITIKKFNKQ